MLSSCVDTNQAEYGDAAEETRQIPDFVASEIMCEQVKTPLYGASLTLPRQSPANARALSEFIGRVRAVSIGNHWNVTPTDDVRPLAGMRNLSTTCYLNAVFQQVVRSRRCSTPFSVCCAVRSTGSCLCAAGARGRGPIVRT
jgi:hypothetical protein